MRNKRKSGFLIEANPKIKNNIMVKCTKFDIQEQLKFHCTYIDIHTYIYISYIYSLKLKQSAREQNNFLQH